MAGKETCPKSQQRPIVLKLCFSFPGWWGTIPSIEMQFFHRTRNGKPTDKGLKTMLKAMTDNMVSLEGFSCLQLERATYTFLTLQKQLQYLNYVAKQPLKTGFFQRISQVTATVFKRGCSEYSFAQVRKNNSFLAS